MNIKYSNFDSSFYTTEFCSEKITHRCENDTLNNTRATPLPKMPSSEAVNAYRVSQYGVQSSNLDLSLLITLGIIGRKRRTTCT
jgi:hypothetical protein